MCPKCKGVGKREGLLGNSFLGKLFVCCIAICTLPIAIPALIIRAAFLRKTVCSACGYKWKVAR